MLTSGEILKRKRNEKNLSLEEIEKVTKIRKKFLEALEKGELEKLPGETYVQGFVKNYADYLDLPTNNILAVLRREYMERKQKDILPQGLSKPLLGPGLLTKKIAIPFAFLFGLVFLGIYLYSQFLSFQKKPILLFVSPKENILVVKKDKYLISGQTEKEASVFINSQEITLRDEGKFQEEVSLKKGTNTFIIIAVSMAGKETKITKTITRQE